MAGRCGRRRRRAGRVFEEAWWWEPPGEICSGSSGATSAITERMEEKKEIRLSGLAAAGCAGGGRRAAVLPCRRRRRRPSLHLNSFACRRVARTRLAFSGGSAPIRGRRRHRAPSARPDALWQPRNTGAPRRALCALPSCQHTAARHKADARPAHPSLRAAPPWSFLLGRRHHAPTSSLLVAMPDHASIFHVIARTPALRVVTPEPASSRGLARCLRPPNSNAVLTSSPPLHLTAAKARSLAAVPSHRHLKEHNACRTGMTQQGLEVY